MDVTSLAIKVDSKDIKRGKVELKELSNQAGKTEKSAGKVDKAFQKTGKTMSKLTKQVFSLQGVFGSLALSMAAIDTIKVGMNFERQMAIVKGVSRATAAEFKDLTDVAREMGKATEWSASQSAEALKFLTMAGLEASQAVGSLPATLDLATAGNIELGRAADIATNAMTSMGLGVKDLNRINDVFIRNITSTNTTMDMLAESFVYAAPVARAYGYEIEELTSYIGVLGNSGIQGSMAGTQLAQAFTKVPKLFKAMGMDGEGKNLIDALELINEKHISNAEIMKIFTVRAGRAVLTLKSQVGALKEQKKRLDDARGATAALAETMRDTTDGALKELKSMIESIKLDVFSEDSDKIKGSLQALTKYLSENQEGIVSGLTSIATGFIAIGRAASKILEYAALRSISGTVSEAVKLSKRGLLDLQEFQKAGFLDRQKMVDEAFAKTIPIIKRYKIGVNKNTAAELKAAQAKQALLDQLAEEQAALDALRRSIEKPYQALLEALDPALKLQREEISAIKLLDDAYKTKLIPTQDELIKKKAQVASYFAKKDTEISESAKQMNQAIQSGMADIFGDAMRGELDSFEDYFESFTDTITNMWAQAAAKMAMEKFTSAGSGGEDGSGGAATGAIGGIWGTFAVIAANIISSEMQKAQEESAAIVEKLSADYIQGQQLTGTILGDISAQSDSTNKALDDILLTDVAGLEISRGMLSALNSVVYANDRLAASIGRGAGDLTSPAFENQTTSLIASQSGSIDKYRANIDESFWLENFVGYGEQPGTVVSDALGSIKKDLINSGVKVYSQTLADIMTESFSGASFATINTRTRKLFNVDESTKDIFGDLSNEVSSGITAMFTGIADAFYYGADVLGISMNGVAERLVIPEQKLSVMGKTAEEAAVIIASFVSMTSDAWATGILFGTGLLEKYQNAGEGAFETYVRLVNQTVYLTASLDSMGLSIDTTGISLVNATQNIINLAGGIEELQASMGTYYTAFYSEAEKQANVTKKMGDSFASLNLILPETREGYKNVVSSLNLANAADQERFTRILALSNVANEYYSALEDTADAFEKLAAAAEAARIETQKLAVETAKLAVENAFVSQTDTINAAYDSVLSTLNDNLFTAYESMQSMSSASSSFASARADMEGLNNESEQYSRTQTELFAALNAARSGDFAGALAVSSKLGAITGGPYGAATETDYQRETLKNLAAIAALEDLTGTQLTIEQQMVAALETQITDLQADRETTIQFNDDLLAAINAMDESVLAIPAVLESIGTLQRSIEMDSTLKQLKALSVLDSSVLQIPGEVKEQTQATLGVNSAVLTIPGALDSISKIEQGVQIGETLKQLTAIASLDQSVLTIPGTMETIDKGLQAANFGLVLDQVKAVSSVRDMVFATSSAEQSKASGFSASQVKALYKISNTVDGAGVNDRKLASALSSDQIKELLVLNNSVGELPEPLKEQVQKLTGVDASVKGIPTAIEELERLQKESDYKNAENQINSLLRVNDSISSVADAVTFLANVMSTNEEDKAALLKEQAKIEDAKQAATLSYAGYEETRKEEEAKIAAASSIYSIQTSWYNTMMSSAEEAKKYLEWLTLMSPTYSTVDEVVAAGVMYGVTEITSAYEKYQAGLSLGGYMPAVTGIYEETANPAQANIDAAMIAYQNAQKKYEDLVSASTPGFASGGVHTGGLRMVGENGPELEYTGPSRIYSNSDTSSMLDNSELISEVRALRTEITSGNYAVAKNTIKTAKILERWDYDGQPETREVA